MKTYPTVVRAGGACRILEQTAAQRGTTDEVLALEARRRALGFPLGWAHRVRAPR